MPDLPRWAQFAGAAFGEEYSSWSVTPCAHQGCGVARWAHRANAIAAQRQAGPEPRGPARYWETCSDFLEPAGTAVPAAGGPLTSGPKRVRYIEDEPRERWDA